MHVTLLTLNEHLTPVDHQTHRYYDFQVPSASWTADVAAAAERAAVPNLLTISLYDADGAYRGAAHRHAPDQSLVLGPDAATPGLVRGPLPGGTWILTLTAHTRVSPHVDVAIQIGAEIASSPA